MMRVVFEHGPLAVTVDDRTGEVNYCCGGLGDLRITHAGEHGAVTLRFDRFIEARPTMKNGQSAFEFMYRGPNPDGRQENEV